MTKSSQETGEQASGRTQKKRKGLSWQHPRRQRPSSDHGIAPEKRREMGEQGERVAATYLSDTLGWRILARNVYFRVGELDIIAAGPDGLVFVEVRSRWTKTGPRAEDSITYTKQLHLSRAALLWLQRHPEWQRQRARFDVISVNLRTMRVAAHHRSAFEAQIIG